MTVSLPQKKRFVPVVRWALIFDHFPSDRLWWPSSESSLSSSSATLRHAAKVSPSNPCVTGVDTLQRPARLECRHQTTLVSSGWTHCKDLPGWGAGTKQPLCQRGGHTAKACQAGVQAPNNPCVIGVDTLQRPARLGCRHGRIACLCRSNI